jgi:hypothetical protein
LLNDSEEISEKFIKERGVLIIVNGLHTIITVVVKCPLQINFDLLINARDERKGDEEAGKLSLDDSAGVLHEFFHLIDDPAICVQLIVLQKSLILFGL